MEEVSGRVSIFLEVVGQKVLGYEVRRGVEMGRLVDGLLFFNANRGTLSSMRDGGTQRSAVNYIPEMLLRDRFVRLFNGASSASV